jgi:hypothetical protein
LYFALLSCQGQNKVPNSSFEEADTCQLGLGFRYPEQGPHHWFSSWGTPDHLQNCLPYGSVNGLPLNGLTFQHAMDGSSCIGMITYHQNGLDQQREWVTVELLEPLLVGQVYFGSFYANAAFGGNFEYPQIWLASSHIGLMFTMAASQWDFPSPNPAFRDAAHIVSSEILADTTEWTLVSGSFVADSAYRYVTIGNFFSNALTDTLHFAAPESVFPWYPRSYSLIDKVCVSESPNGCDMGSGMLEAVLANVAIFPNPAMEELALINAAGTLVVIHDAMGRSVWEGSITADEWVLNVSSWARGLYNLRLQDVEKFRSFKFLLVGQ